MGEPQAYKYTTSSQEPKEKTKNERRGQTELTSPLQGPIHHTKSTKKSVHYLTRSHYKLLTKTKGKRQKNFRGLEL